MAKQLLGKEVTAAMNEKLQAKVAELKEKGVTPKLGIIRCGENPSDLSYEKGAMSRAALIGVEVERFLLPEDVSKEALLQTIDAINANDSIHGVLLFRPLPKHLKADQDEICNRLAPQKDVDGMTPGSLAGLLTGRGGFAPCTAQACLELLDYYGVDPAGRRAVVIGRSLVVGQPAALLLQRRNATVTVCHTGTRDIPALCRDADIVIAAAGRPGLITADCLRLGQTVLDVGVHPGPDGTLCGDVAPEAAGLDLALTPVPGGVGSVTSAVLCKHTIQAAENTRL